MVPTSSGKLTHLNKFSFFFLCIYTVYLFIYLFISFLVWEIEVKSNIFWKWIRKIGDNRREWEWETMIPTNNRLFVWEIIGWVKKKWLNKVWVQNSLTRFGQVMSSQLNRLWSGVTSVLKNINSLVKTNIFHSCLCFSVYL